MISAPAVAGFYWLGRRLDRLRAGVERICRLAALFDGARFEYEPAKMMGTKTRHRGALRIAAAGLALLAATSAASAERHALLIGIGHYPQLYDLEGPRNDVEALAEELVANWGFAPEHVHRLLDSEATKSGILDALDRLLADTEPGDHVLVYYSGHGTSAFDGEPLPAGEGLLGEWTGALMPYDYAARLTSNPSPAQWLDGLIVGRRDLEPRLLKLDRDRDVLVIFDTSFSGRTVRSVAERAARWVSPPAFGATRSFRVAGGKFASPVFGSAEAGEPRYPYRRLIYLAAAGKKERAEELPGRWALDQRPHGALTNALLEALAGGADADRDERLTYSEVFEYVRRDVAERHVQRPRLFYPDDVPGLVSRPIFDHEQRFPSRARALLELAYPRPDFALRLELPGGRRVLYRGEGFEIAAGADRPAVFLLVNVDKSGAVSVLFPAEAAEMAPRTGLREAFQVVPPYGTDNLKLFAFSRAPEGLDEWIDRKVDASDPRLGELLGLLERPGVERAETRLEVVTSRRGRTP